VLTSNQLDYLGAAIVTTDKHCDTMLAVKIGAGDRTARRQGGWHFA
jgi:hypothetical protein